MEKTYFELVKNHRRTCNPENTSVKMVPEKYLEAVIAMLEADGRDTDGNKIK